MKNLNTLDSFHLLTPQVFKNIESKSEEALKKNTDLSFLSDDIFPIDNSFADLVKINKKLSIFPNVVLLQVDLSSSDSARFFSVNNKFVDKMFAFSLNVLS